MTSVQHVYFIDTSRTTWKHCHVYHVNGGCPRGQNKYHMIPILGSRNAINSVTILGLGRFDIHKFLLVVNLANDAQL